MSTEYSARASFPTHCWVCLLSPCFLLGHSRLAKPATTRRSQVAGRRSQVAGRRSLVAGRRSQVVATMRCGVTLADGGLAGWRAGGLAALAVVVDGL